MKITINLMTDEQVELENFCKEYRLMLQANLDDLHALYDCSKCNAMYHFGRVFGEIVEMSMSDVCGDFSIDEVTSHNVLTNVQHFLEGRI